jgi:hypothetical protein
MLIPDGASTAQAALVFAREAARGNISKLTPGAILANPETLATLRTDTIPGEKTTQTQGPDVSRLERGTADEGREADVAGIVALTRRLLSYPLINNIPITDNINVADYVIQTPPTFGVANLSIDQIQSLMAARAAVVDQDSTAISQQKGVGRYGLNALQLELAGYLKPGTALKYFGQSLVWQANPADFVATMQSPAIWTGLNGIDTVDKLLADSLLQATIMQQLYQQAYDNLLNLGTMQLGGITADPIVQGLILQNAVQYGVIAATAWAVDQPPALLVASMQATARQALYALQLLDKKINPNEALITPPTAYVGTYSEASSIEDAKRAIIDNAKIGTGPG